MAQLLVMVLLAGIAMQASMGFLQLLRKNQMSLSSEFDIDERKLLIARTLSNSTRCTDLLKGYSINLQAIKQGESEEVLKLADPQVPGQFLASPGLAITNSTSVLSLALTDVREITPDAEYGANLSVLFSNKNRMGGQTTGRKIGLLFQTEKVKDGTVKIVSCLSQDRSPSSHASNPQLIAVHSQSTKVPSCPNGTTLLRTGYSFLMYGVGGSSTAGQDLGSPGSCLPEFDPMPFQECKPSANNGKCNEMTLYDYSYWLGAEKIDRWPVHSRELMLTLISRCAVCEAPSLVVAVHSQTENLPNCPTGYDELWNGYSFLAAIGGGTESGSQSLSSPGSCLREFRPIPFTECSRPSGNETCDYSTANDYSYWLTNSKAVQKDVGVIQAERQTSRCRVCMRN